jgi:hypothetical protein
MGAAEDTDKADKEFLRAHPRFTPVDQGTQDKTGRLQREIRKEDKALDEADENPNLVFSRSVDNAEITLRPELSLDLDSPHQIQENFISEGFYCMGEIKRPYYMKGFSKNYQGIGKEHEETVVEPVPMLLVAEVKDGQPWLDAKRRIVPQQPMILGGRSKNWKESVDYRNLMSYEIANKIALADPTAPIDIQKTIEVLRDDIRRLFWMDKQASTVIALWDAGTYVHQAFLAYPYLWLNGLKGTAKTSILEHMNRIVYHAKMSSMMTNSALFRSVDETQATILCDEGESLLVVGGKEQDQESRKRVSLFNAGYKAGATVTLSESKGEKFVVRNFSAYSPKAIASIGAISDTLQSRSLIVIMLKAMEGSYSTELVDEAKCRQIVEQLYHFRFQDGVKMRSDATDPHFGVKLSKEYQLKNREFEIFKPILILAKHLTPGWLDEVKSFIEDQKTIQAIDNRLTTDAQICILLYEKVIEGENEPSDTKTVILYREFLEFIKQVDPGLKWLHPKSLGNILRRAGLTKLLDKWGKGAVIKLDKVAIAEALERMGVDVDDHISKRNGRKQCTLPGGDSDG